MTLTFKLDVDKVVLNYSARYLGQGSFRSTVYFLGTHTDSHTQPSALPGPHINSRVK